MKEEELPNYLGFKGLEWGDKRNIFHVLTTFRKINGTSVHEGLFENKHQLEIRVHDRNRWFVLEYKTFMDNFDELMWQEHPSLRGPILTKAVPYSLMKEIPRKGKSNGQRSLF